MITRRIKHRSKRWLDAAENKMVKILARKTNRKLHETISRYTEVLVFKNEIINVLEILNVANTQKDGKGNPYADR